MRFMVVHSNSKGKPVPACPRPLSRKQLRGMMPRNHENLTASALAYQFDRKPGGGRTRRRLEHLEHQLRKQEEAAANTGLAEMVAARLAWVGRMLARAAGQNPARRQRAVRTS